MQGLEQAVPHSTGTAPPKLIAPAKTADCHIHIYDARYNAQSRIIDNSTVAEYRLLQKRIGFERVVIVTPRCYVTDNTVTVDAIKALGIYNARGVAVLRPDVTDAQLKQLNDGGIRGIRFTVGEPKTAVTSIDMIEPLAKRIAAYGWHVQLNMPCDKIAEHADMLRRLPTQVVFDHLGHPTIEEGIRHPSHAVIRGMLDQRKAWVKISGAYMNTRIGPPTYADATLVAQAFVKAAPERLVWGSDWPHPTPKVPPDDAVLFDLLTTWVADDATRNRILVENPQVLYGFPK
ncbi:MAG: 2-pyrone-4,6-dicarboxylate hydrolase [Betaproteobacteria bacterium]|nr:2-pyrone-4,6-dicarboxylate hydrolase [Betaproteobacteria bacterium]